VRKILRPERVFQMFRGLGYPMADVIRKTKIPVVRKKK
jgi:hypothetical protein